MLNARTQLQEGAAFETANRVPSLVAVFGEGSGVNDKIGVDLAQPIHEILHVRKAWKSRRKKLRR